MRTPEALETLVDYGIVEEVLRPLMSGKEAQIYLVRSGGELRVAKIYKDAQQRSFKQRAEYTEGRTTRNTRDRRAMAKHSRHGKAQDEAAWRSAEVNAIYRLSEAGVRVPTPYHFIDGVLVMELVVDHEGQPAPRLGDVVYAPEVARRIFEMLLAAVVRMLCAGVVHGDLSEFNVLMAADGPVVIDFPQAVDPASNTSARKLLIRDVDNLHRFMSRYARGYRALPYAQEMWELYQQNLLTPETVLRGRVSAVQRPTNTADVLALIGDAEREQRRRTAGLANPPNRGGGAGAGPARGPRGPKVEVVVPRAGSGAGAAGPRSGSGHGPRAGGAGQSSGSGPRAGAAGNERTGGSGSGPNSGNGPRAGAAGTGPGSGNGRSSGGAGNEGIGGAGNGHSSGGAGNQRIGGAGNGPGSGNGYSSGAGNERAGNAQGSPRGSGSGPAGPREGDAGRAPGAGPGDGEGRRRRRRGPPSGAASQGSPSRA
ncbi:MAG: phosphotransferase [Myxococcales bacterium]|nr:phosphotransferase [Myxococcales bacterium]